MTEQVQSPRVPTDRERMTDRDAIVFLAEKVMGWKVCRCEVCKSSPQIYDRDDACRTSWNPLVSLAEAFEVQAAIPKNKRDDFTEHLEQILRKDNPKFWLDVGMYWLMVNATARQRSEAAIRAVNPYAGETK